MRCVRDNVFIAFGLSRMGQFEARSWRTSPVQSLRAGNSRQRLRCLGGDHRETRHRQSAVASLPVDGELQKAWDLETARRVDSQDR